MRYERQLRLAVNRQGVIGRRHFLKGISAAGLAAGTLSWTDLMMLKAGELRQRGMACIVLWMGGGPSQFETFDPKPGHENGGETQAISTSVPGIQISDRFPQVAKVMDHLAILRSMTSREGNHQRASFLLHTGYPPSASVKYPSIGALAAHEIANQACELPAFVRIGRRDRNFGNGGFLGVEYDPFELQGADEPPANTKPMTEVARYQRRLGLLGRLDAEYASRGQEDRVAEHKKLYAKTSKMILSPQMETFDLDQEPDAMRDAYGRTPFGNGCLLARRLVENGVTFVEVASPANWDTHFDNFPRTEELAGNVDQPMAQLISDLNARGMLDSTLVIWMGEFGRTPRINARAGRDHYPRSFNAVLAGGGIRGGQVIGATDEGGTEVIDQPISVQDLFQSICKSLKMDADAELMSPIGRPIRIVEGGTPVASLFG